MPQNSKLKVWWPDGKLDSAPRDGEVWRGHADTYTWDGLLESWVTGYRGNLVDFAPPGQPSKVYEGGTISPVEFVEAEINLDISPRCECGAEKVGSSRHSSWCQKHTGGPL